MQSVVRYRSPQGRDRYRNDAACDEEPGAVRDVWRDREPRICRSSAWPADAVPPGAGSPRHVLRVHSAGEPLSMPTLLFKAAAGAVGELLTRCAHLDTARLQGRPRPSRGWTRDRARRDRDRRSEHAPHPRRILPSSCRVSRRAPTRRERATGRQHAKALAVCRLATTTRVRPRRRRAMLSMERAQHRVRTGVDRRRPHQTRRRTPIREPEGAVQRAPRDQEVAREGNEAPRVTRRHPVERHPGLL